MTQQQDVLDPRRPRRRIPVILLGILPGAIAATLLVAGPHYVEPVHAATAASGGGTIAVDAALITPGVIAPAVTSARVVRRRGTTWATTTKLASTPAEPMACPLGNE